jgi:exonuclease SbcD
MEMGAGVPFTFIHAADLHLDSPFKGLSKVPAAVRERLRESTFAAMRKLTELAKREKVDFVVLAGDLFDMAERSLRAQLRLQRELAALAELGIEVFVVHGNHDPESGRHAKLDVPHGVFVFGSGEVGCRPAHNREGEVVAHVYGISYLTPAVTDNLALRFKVQEGAPFHLAVLHANVDGNPSFDNYAPCRLDELVTSGFQYWALGHIHDRRVLHEYPHVVYPGNIQGRSIRETDHKGAYVVSVSGTGAIDMKFEILSDVLWQEQTISIEGLQREQELKERLLDLCDKLRVAGGGRPTIVRIRLDGRGVLNDRLLDPAVVSEWLEELREWLGDPELTEAWVWPESIVVRTESPLRLEAVMEEEGFLGELLRMGKGATMSSEASASLVSEAMDSLRRQPHVREWLDSRTHEERMEWIKRAMELSASLVIQDTT